MLFVLPLFLSFTLGLATTSASPTKTREEYFSFPPPDITPNKPLGEGPGFKQCKKSPIRYNPQHFVCYDNEILCPILDQGSGHPNPMQRCGDTCYDATETTCADKIVIPGPPKRSWELGVDLAFAHHIKHFPNPSSADASTDETEEEEAAQTLLKRYSLTLGFTLEDQEEDQPREEDAGLRIDKRSASAAPYPVPWRRESMRTPPVVRVKQTWDPRQRQQEMQQQGKIENGRSRAVEGSVTGEENFPHPWQRVMRVEVKANPEEEQGEEDEYEVGEYEVGEYEVGEYEVGEYEVDECECEVDKYEESDEYEESDYDEDEYEESDYDEDEYEESGYDEGKYKESDYDEDEYDWDDEYEERNS